MVYSTFFMYKTLGDYTGKNLYYFNLSNCIKMQNKNATLLVQFQNKNATLLVQFQNKNATLLVQFQNKNATLLVQFQNKKCYPVGTIPK